MRTLTLLLAGCLMLVPVIGCGSGGSSGSHGDCLDECEVCSSTSQCCEGWSCVGFTDGINRCSRIGRTCP